MLVTLWCLLAFGFLVWRWWPRPDNEAPLLEAPTEPSDKKAPLVESRAKLKATAEELQAFFSEAENYMNLDFVQLEAKLGAASYQDDWDWGRVVFTWSRPTYRVMVMGRGGGVKWVQEQDPNDCSRFGTRIRTLYGDSSP
jgi:hypothetical protein